MSITLDGLQLSINRQAFKIEDLETRVSSLQKSAIDISSLKENITHQDVHKEHLYKAVEQYEKYTSANTKSIDDLSKYAQSIDAKVENLTTKVDKFILPTLEKIVKNQSEMQATLEKTVKNQSEMQEGQKKTNDLLSNIASKLNL